LVLSSNCFFSFLFSFVLLTFFLLLTLSALLSAFYFTLGVRLVPMASTRWNVAGPGYTLGLVREAANKMGGGTSTLPLASKTVFWPGTRH
jgi:hypothetical protein